jgi:hypothetical protein
MSNENEPQPLSLEARDLFYILDENNNPVPEHDIIKFMDWRNENPQRCIVQQTHLNTPDGMVFISTIFVGMNASFSTKPLLFETAVFTNGELSEINKHFTWNQATIFHQELALTYQPNNQ